MAITTKSTSPSLSNAAVARCVKAYERTYKLVSESFAANGKPLDEGFAREQARGAFSDALPPLCGEDNIRDFIACVTYGMIKESLTFFDGKHLLAAARVALSAARAKRRQPGS